MTTHANRGYAMPEACEIEENFEILKGMFINSRQNAIQLEQQKIKLEQNLKILTEANLSLKETNDRLLVVNDTQQMMLSQYDLSLTKIELLTTELEALKQENFNLRSSFNNKKGSSSNGGSIENYNTLLQNKILHLEKQLLQNQTLIRQKSSFNCTKHEKELSILKVKNNALFFENKSLKEQLTNFRSLHHKILSEIRLRNPKFGDGSQQVRNTPYKRMSPETIDLLDQDDVQPIQVHIIDSD